MQLIVTCMINMHLWEKKRIPKFEIICLDLYIFFLSPDIN